MTALWMGISTPASQAGQSGLWDTESLGLSGPLVRRKAGMLTQAVSHLGHGSLAKKELSVRPQEGKMIRGFPHKRLGWQGRRVPGWGRSAGNAPGQD